MNLDTTPFDTSDGMHPVGMHPVSTSMSPPTAYTFPSTPANMPMYAQSYHPGGATTESAIGRFFSYIFGMSRTAYIVIAILILMVIFIPTVRDIADTTIRGVLFALIILGVIYIANKF